MQGKVYDACPALKHHWVKASGLVGMFYMYDYVHHVYLQTVFICHMTGAPLHSKTKIITFGNRGFNQVMLKKNLEIVIG